MLKFDYFTFFVDEEPRPADNFENDLSYKSPFDLKIETVYKWIVGVSSVLNYQNNAVLQFFPPIFTELALERGVSPTGIGVILAMYSFGIVI